MLWWHTQFVIIRLLYISNTGVTNVLIFFLVNEMKSLFLSCNQCWTRFVIKCHNMVCLYSKTSRKSITLLPIVICLKLLNQEYILHLLPNCENFGVFPDLSLCSEIPYNFSYVGWVFNCLALSSGSIHSCCGLIRVTEAMPCQILLLAT